MVQVARGPIESSIELTGTLYPWKYATVAAEVTGLVESIQESEEKIEYELDGKPRYETLPLDMGHAVKEGEILATIRSSELQHALRVAKAKQALVEKQLAKLLAWKRSEEVAQLEAQCEECEAILMDARADLARAEKLKARNATSENDVEDAQRAVKTAEAAKKRAESALELATAGPTEEEIAVAKAELELARARVALKQEEVDKCTIRCPLENARIVERYVGQGEHVTANPSTPLMRLVDSSILMAEVNVPERYQGLVQVHQQARVSLEGISVETAGSGESEADRMPRDQVEAMVVLVNAQVDPDTRTFRVRVGIDNSRKIFKAGTFVRVTIPVRTAPEATVVPVEAVTFSEGQPAAFVVEKGVVDRIPLTLGISNRAHYQVIKGLSKGDLVVKGNLSLLAPGLRVTPRSVVADSTDLEPETIATNRS